MNHGMKYQVNTSIEARIAELEFVKEAAKAFSANPELATYGSREAGSFLALSGWGMMERGIKVLKLADDYQPVVYDDAVVRP